MNRNAATVSATANLWMGSGSISPEARRVISSSSIDRTSAGALARRLAPVDCVIANARTERRALGGGEHPGFAISTKRPPGASTEQAGTHELRAERIENDVHAAPTRFDA